MLEIDVVLVVIVLLCLGRVGVEARRGRDRGYFSFKTISMLFSCFALYLCFFKFCYFSVRGFARLFM